MYVERYNGAIKFSAVSSGNVVNSFGINAESGVAEASSSVASSIVYWGMPNYPSIVSVGNVSDRAAPANVVVKCTVTGRTTGYFYVGGLTFPIEHNDGYGTTNRLYRDFYVPKGWKYSTANMTEVHEIPLIGG